ncbi:VOC family protein [uncultured Paraglaciecola sp.]|uniref:VOC family protein n=1 Tax=uncultured Paraglaciecola sp. TaxID=1765024 RepID=UPI0030DA3BD5
MTSSTKVRTCLWFDNNGEQAAQFYVSLIPGSNIENIFCPDPSEPPLMIEFNLAGTPYLILNAGPMFPHTEAASISVTTKDQVETDFLWQALIAEGGSASQCAWLKDRFGLSWQIVPEVLPQLLADSDTEAARRVMQTMMGMQKIDISQLQAAFNNTYIKEK